MIGRHNINTGPLTNITKGGQGGCGPHSKETKVKMSKAQKGKAKSEQHKQSLKNAHSRRKEWLLINKEGKQFNVTNLAEFASANNLVYRELLKVSQRTEANKHIHRAKTHRGWTCKKL